MPTITFRFYAELNDFLPDYQRRTAFAHSLRGDASVKDRIEAVGVPHTEVEAIMVDGRPVGFNYLVQKDDRIAVYPAFHSLELDHRARLRPDYTGKACFVLDAHLGKLASFLRMLGFDSLYRNDYDDASLAGIGSSQGRIVLTRDLGVLKRREIVYGYYIRSTSPEEQVREVLHRFDLYGKIAPFNRCLSCNGRLEPVSKHDVLDRLEPLTRRYYDEFYQCQNCLQVYWKGSHYERMERVVRRLSTLT